MSEFEFHYREGLPHRPVILSFHGTGGDEHWFSELAADLAPDDGYFGVRGRVQEQGMNRYFRRFSEGKLDFEDLRERTKELANWLSTRSELKNRPAVAIGYSNGANIAQSLLLSGVDLFDHAILLRPMILSSLLGKDLSGRRVLILAGEWDEICDPDESVELSRALAEAGAQSEIKLIPAGHGLTRMDVEQVSSFLGSMTATI